MADSSVSITQGTGTPIDITTVTTAAGTVDRQRVSIGDAVTGGNSLNIDNAGAISVSAIGGAFVTLPTPTQNGTIIPSGPTGTEFTCAGGATPGSVTYTIATSQPSSPILLRQTIAGGAGTSSVVDQVNLAAGTHCYVTASAGLVFYRTI